MIFSRIEGEDGGRLLFVRARALHDNNITDMSSRRESESPEAVCDKDGPRDKDHKS